MNRENPDQHELDQHEPEAAAPTTRPDEFMVQTKRVIESWDHPKKTVLKEYGPGESAPAAGSPKEYVAIPDTAKPPVKTTKLVNGYIGPFRNRAIAEQVASSMCMMESTISAEVITVVDGPAAPAADKQVPASEDILRQMVSDGKVPGVPADATVRVEGEPQAATTAPDNLVAFPGTEADAGVRPE